jgi:hypothetical protein
MFSNHYNAVAGRTQMGDAACDCDDAEPPCYEGDTLCNGPLRATIENHTNSIDDTTPIDGASIGLMLFVSAYMLWRFLP